LPLRLALQHMQPKPVPSMQHPLQPAPDLVSSWQPPPARPPTLAQASR
jgi:hypothetical protein